MKQEKSWALDVGQRVSHDRSADVCFDRASTPLSDRNIAIRSPQFRSLSGVEGLVSRLRETPHDLSGRELRLGTRARNTFICRVLFAAFFATVFFANAYAEPPAADTPATTPEPKAAEPARKPTAKKSAKSESKDTAQPAAATKRSADRLELDTSVVTGNRELPKVLYIVPWKKADLGDLPAQPFNTLLDEALTPVDRDVFRREVSYYQAVTSGASGAGEAKEGK